MLLGHGELVDSSNRPHVFYREKFTEPEYEDWLHDEFEDVEFSIYEHEGELELQIGPFKRLDNWRERWYHRKERTIPAPDQFSLTPEMASVWYWRRGSWDSKYERVRLDMNGLSHSKERGVEILKNQDFAAYKTFNKIEMRADDAKTFLDWLSDEISGLNTRATQRK